MSTRALLAAALTLLATLALASERGTKEDARRLAERGAAYLQEHGGEHAFPLFSDPAGGFVDRDLYIFVLSSDGAMLAHGRNPKTVGKNIWHLKDVDGQLIAQNAIRTAQAEGAGWTSPYRFPDPLRRSIGTKQSYVIAVEGVVLGVGFFRETL